MVVQFSKFFSGSIHAAWFVSFQAQISLGCCKANDRLRHGFRYPEQGGSGSLFLTARNTTSGCSSPIVFFFSCPSSTCRPRKTTKFHTPEEKACVNFFNFLLSLGLGCPGQVKLSTQTLRRNCTCRKRGYRLHRTSCFLVITTQRTDDERIKERIALRWSPPETRSRPLLRSHSLSSSCIKGTRCSLRLCASFSDGRECRHEGVKMMWACVRDSANSFPLPLLVMCLARSILSRVLGKQPWIGID